mmetsp:Transcript_69398/g.206739  ORF Transcript_69398/g.206739 Transcript_69398/m.206739 type:complete len:356 (-) Transcript_69398:51-1118(-)
MHTPVALALVAALAPCRTRAVRAETLSIFAAEDKSAEFDVCTDHHEEAKCRAEPGRQCFWRPSESPPCAPALSEHCFGMTPSDCHAFPEVCRLAYDIDGPTSCSPGPSPCTDIKDESQCNNLECMFRKKPVDCVPRIPENCAGLDQTSCELHSNVCEWPRGGPASCRGRGAALLGVAASSSGPSQSSALIIEPANSSRPAASSSTPRQHSSLLSEPVNGSRPAAESRLHSILQRAMDLKCAQYGFQFDGNCHQVSTVFVAVTVLVLATFCCLWCSCCRRKDDQSSDAPAGRRLLNRNLRGPEFPPPPGTRLTAITIPEDCAPGRPFRFKHPHTGQLMQATAPADGNRILKVLSAG